MDEVYMDVPAVRDIAKTFGTISDVLEGVSKALETLINILRMAAAIGLVAAAALAQFAEMIKPHIDNMARKTAELSRDVAASVAAYERGDARGATRFY